MHEYGLMESVIKSILERLEQEGTPAKVEEVTLKIGVLDVHSEPAARQAFTVLSGGTPLEHARLHLTILPAALECLSCAHSAPFLVDHFHGHEPFPLVDCPKCGGLAQLKGGRGVEAIDLVLAEAESGG